YLNEGFSGGEKKRCEILQLAILQPKIAVLDETDSGLDIDSVKIVAEGVNKLVGPEMGVMIITHYQRILRYIKPDHVHILLDGRMVKSGGPELADAKSADLLGDAEIDYVETEMGGGFKFNFPESYLTCGCGHSFVPKGKEQATGARSPEEHHHA